MKNNIGNNDDDDDDTVRKGHGWPQSKEHLLLAPVILEVP